MLNSYENSQISLHEVACFYLNQGWSVIPLWGDSKPNQPKSPLVAWKEYQQRLASVGEVQAWFRDLPVAALGIVCGSVSRLLVLDFDHAQMAEAFARALPDLTRTFTVYSGGRGLPHYYYRLAAGVTPASQHFSGADLLSNGTYVVAPPSEIGGSAWEVVCNMQPVALSQRDIERIQVFFEAYAYQDAEHKTVEEGLSIVTNGLLTGSEPYSDGAVCRWYRDLAARIGRNEGLFRVACFLRDVGRPRGDVLALLGPLHAVQITSRAHHAETQAQRHREAVRTINSVFARPPRPRVLATSIHGLPTTVREILLQQGLVSAARVLDGLLLYGVGANHALTEAELCLLLRQCGIGRRTVQNALKTVLAGGEMLFECLGSGSESPLNPPIQTHAYADPHPQDDRTKCFFVRATKRVKTGCPPAWYRVPTVAELCRMLRVEATTSDVLTRADLASPKAYRMALQRQLFRRRPGQYSRRWLARRLNVTVRTCQRYDHEAGYSRRPMFHERLMTWGDARVLPGERLDPIGIFLETEDGKRYPPIRAVAMRLLHRGKRLLMKRQDWNFYTLEQVIEKQPPAITAAAVLSENSHEAPSHCDKNHKYDPALPAAACEQTLAPASAVPDAEPEKHFWLCDQCMNWHVRSEQPGNCRQCGEKQWRLIPAEIWQDVERCKHWWRGLKKARKLGKASSSLALKPVVISPEDQLAERLYVTLYERNPQRALTRGKAKRLVGEYGTAQVEAALEVLAGRSDIHNPAGFIIAHLRREQAKAEAAQEVWKPITLEDIRRSMLEAHRAFWEEFRASPYANWFGNVEYVTYEV